MNTLLLLLAPWANIDGQQVSKEIQSNTISSNGIWMLMKGLTNQRNLIKELLDFPPGCSSMWKTKLCCWPCEDSISISQMSFWQMRDRNQPLIPAWGSIQAKPRRDLLICNYFQITLFRWFQINWELEKNKRGLSREILARYLFCPERFSFVSLNNPKMIILSERPCMIIDPDACMYDAYINDPWSWCMYVWCIHLWSLILMHVCMMHTSMTSFEIM